MAGMLASGKYWTTDPEGYLEPQISNYGYAAVPAVTVIEQFKNTVKKHGESLALLQKKAVDVCLLSTRSVEYKFLCILSRENETIL
jgi:hypothetical protein